MIVRNILLVLIFLATALPAVAQTTSTITGRVVDEQGGVLPGATVTVREIATGLTRTAFTGSEGRFTLASVPVGTYQLKAEVNGFQPREVHGIRTAVGETVELTVVM